jgi:lysophospholipase L1-like esterase
MKEFQRFILILAALLSGCGGTSSTIPPETKNLTAFMGDSITAFWNIPAYDSHPTVNLGVIGDTTVQMLARFDLVTAAAPGVVVILGGVNDFLLLGPDATNIDSIKQMASQARAGGIKVILCSVMPQDYIDAATPIPNSDIAAFNQQLLTVARENGYLYADYYDEFLNADGSVNNVLLNDGLHPNAAGYGVMWKVLEPLLAEDLP